MKTSTLLICSLIAALVIGCVCMHRNQRERFRRHGEYQQEIHKLAPAVKTYNDLHSRSHFLAQAPNIPKSIFYPAPALAGRVQSTQFEHLAAEDPNIDVDYQAILPWPLTKPASMTRGAFIQAALAQIGSMRSILLKPLDPTLVVADLNFEFDSIFTEAMKNNARILMNWPAGNTDLPSLQTYQAKMSDNLFESIQNLMGAANKSVTATALPTGIQVDIAAIGIRHLQGQSAPCDWSNKNYYTQTGDALIAKAPLKGVAIRNMTRKQLLYIAQQHVKSTFVKIKDKYSHLIAEMDICDFTAASPTILAVGNEMVADFIRANNPTPSELDAFSSNVEEAMTEAMFDILLAHDVDVEQYDDPAAEPLVSLAVPAMQDVPIHI